MSEPSNVVPMPQPRPREHPEFVDRRQLARIMGVSERTISRLVTEGMPSETWGLRARRFQPAECIDWARSRRAA